MATPVAERPGSTVQKNARMSAGRRAKRPIPATRREAEALFEPSRAYTPAHGGWLMRMNLLGLLHPERRPLTKLEAYHAVLDALYPEG